VSGAVAGRFEAKVADLLCAWVDFVRRRARGVVAIIALASVGSRSSRSATSA
jgi:hypothetical protein